MTGCRRCFLLVFDLDGTLLDFSKSEQIALQKTLAAYGHTLSDAQTAEYTRINREEWRQFELGNQNKEETTVRRFQRFLCGTALGVLFPLAAEINARYLTNLSEIAILEDHAYETLEKLQERGYRMGLLSNGVRRVQERRVALSGLKPFFTHILTSEEVGVGKPHPDMFLSILERFRTSPEESLYIGDSYESDILGAQAVGMETLWYRKDAAGLSGTGEDANKSDTFSDWRCFSRLLDERERRKFDASC
ncbi:MAG TPA: YjjG family noncanonical pyrimidine nucleotidase [Thermotogota bacterium]|nr:YjjG family noncanonical pyrimidine nucleotidase [Thermotogota bacterium]HPH09859.1 YjjG family noncanonical pyrimidine nucleotidase [Thermotogota bacterium]